VSVTAQVDHLVIAARSLEQGVAWCEASFGITPGPGGSHRLMGTHNRLFAIGSPRYPQAYLEIISVDPAAPAPGRPRWFDLDDPALQRALSEQPRLVHFVARRSPAAHALAAARALGIDPGDLVAAERETPDGMLRWQITIPPDGRLRFGGAFPTLIEWSMAHPADSMGVSGVALSSLATHHPRAAQLDAGYRAIGLREVTVHEGRCNLVATFDTPRGPVTLHSHRT
jgi:hypothetical protein